MALVTYELNLSIIKNIRGTGLLIGIQLHTDQTKFIKKLIDNKLLTIRAAENVVRILPPLNVKKSEVNQALKIINKGIIIDNPKKILLTKQNAHSKLIK